MKAAKIQPLDEDSVLYRGLGISLIIHVVIFAIFTIRTVFFAPEKIDFSQAIRVDMVGLPEKLQSLPPAAKPESKPALPEKAAEVTPPKPAEKVVEKTPPAAKPSPKANDAVNLDKVKNQQKNALDKLKALAALEKIKEDVAVEAKNNAKPKPDSNANQVKGNVISSGSSLTGLDKLQHDSYISDLDTHIKKSWQLPQWLANRDYKAQVLLKFDSRGNILERKIIKSSGNPSYDEEVLATIDRSAPLPAPPEKFVAYVANNGIKIGFPE